MKAISLFSSSGIGDLGIKANNIDIVVSCEKEESRHELYHNNYPNCHCITGDIWNKVDEIVNYYNQKFDEEPFLIMATPPCQGMSSNGAGKLLNEFRKGNRKALDERNRLIIPAIEIILRLKPKWIIFENVPEMINTLIEDEDGELVNIIDYMNKKLKPLYQGKPEVVNVADYGVPQNRKRLITIFTKTKEGKLIFNQNDTLLPKKTHENNWITLKEAIGHIPPLDAKKGKEKNLEVHPLHYVPVLKEDHYYWVENTKEGDTAFNNQCVNPKCRYQNNTKHGTNKSEGINKSNNNTPLYCEKCGELLPRPWVHNKKDNSYRLMKGYVSAYKRMSWDNPASTLTQNFQFACSDNKILPSLIRVLLIYEALILQSISEYDYNFEVDGKLSRTGLIRDSIGESVPPKLIDLICKNILRITRNEIKIYNNVSEVEQLTFI